MARVQYGSEVTELRGSIGGTTFHRTTSGNIAKRKPNPISKSTAKQFYSRSYFSTFRSKWSLLSTANQVLWNEYAALHTKFNYFNEEKALTGMNWYISANINSLIAGGFEMSVPPDYLVPDSPPPFVVEWTNWILRTDFGTDYYHTSDYLFIYATPPLRTVTTKNRKDIRLIAIVPPGADMILDLTSAYLLAFGLTMLPSSPDGSAKILISMSAVSDSSYIATPFSSAIAQKLALGSFDVGASVDATAYGCCIASDGGIYYWGAFTSYNSIIASHIIKLRPDGSIDYGFSTGIGFNDVVLCVKEYTDGSLYVGGLFTSFNGQPAKNICKLTKFGAIDSTFASPTTFEGYVQCITIESTGKIYIGGNFTNYNGTSVTHFLRLNANGSIDTTLTPPSIGGDIVSDILCVSADYIAIVGDFYVWNSVACGNMFAIHANGAKITGFNVSPGADARINCIAVADSTHLYVGGDFSSINSVDSSKFARINLSGAITTDVDNPSGFNYEVKGIAVSGTNVFVCGSFWLLNGEACMHIVKLNNALTKDYSFDVGNDCNDDIFQIDSDINDFVYIAGSFTSIWSEPLPYACRLLPNGFLDYI